MTQPIEFTNIEDDEFWQECKRLEGSKVPVVEKRADFAYMAEKIRENPCNTEYLSEDLKSNKDIAYTAIDSCFHLQDEYESPEMCLIAVIHDLGNSVFTDYSFVEWVYKNTKDADVRRVLLKRCPSDIRAKFSKH